MSDAIKELLKQQAGQLGFHDVRITAVDHNDDAAQFLEQFLADNRHGDMDWMAKHADRRRSPVALWPEAKTAIVVALTYAPDENPLPDLQQKQRSVISVYAQGKDYHDIVKPKLKHLARTLQSATQSDVKVFVDTAPLMEKPLAEKAGLGWQGKHTNLVSRTGGSWFFIGVILTTAELDPDDAEQDHCGDCTRCLDICPTHAFPAPYQLDARRCISYLTIEHKGHIPVEFRAAMGNRIYGCDDCLAVCPWNKFAVMGRDNRLNASTCTDNPPLTRLLQMDDAAFRERFRTTPVKRTGRDRMMRNILIAAGNSGCKALIPDVLPHLTDPSPLVRAMAVWALGQLEEQTNLTSRFSKTAQAETDAEVRKEWARLYSTDQTLQNIENVEEPSLNRADPT